MRLSSASSALTAALIVLSLSPRAAAQTQPAFQAELTMELIQDVDGSGDATCGDLVLTRVELVPTALAVLEDVQLEVPIDPRTELRPNTLQISNPNGPTTILSGTDRDDSSVTLGLGDVCAFRECYAGPITVEYRVALGATGTSDPTAILAIQGVVSGSNFPDALTDEPPVDNDREPTEFVFTCADDPSGGGNIDISATLVDTLVGDQDGDGLVDAGDTVRYTAQTRNTGTLTSPNTTYTALLDPASTLLVGSVTASEGTVIRGNNPGDDRIQVAIGTLTSRVVTISYDAVVRDPVPSGIAELTTQGQVRNQVQAATRTDDPDQPGTADPTVTPLDFDPDLQLTKDDGGISVTAGEVIPYSLTVSNLSRTATAGVEIRETVPAHTTFHAGGSSPGWSCTDGAPAGTVCRLAVGTLAANGTSSRTFAVRVTDTLPAGVAEIRNSASVQDDGAAGADPNPANNAASDTTPLTDLAPNFTLAKVLIPQDEPPAPGELLGWELQYANTGNQDADDVLISEELPEHTTFFAPASAPGWTCPPPGSGSTCIYLLGDLPAGDSGAIPFVVRVDPALPAGVESIENCASISLDSSPPPGPQLRTGTSKATVQADACSVVPIPEAAPDLRITKTDGDFEAMPGDVIIYDLVLSNPGTQDATGVEVRETVPAHTTFDPSSSSAGFSCTSTAAGGSCVLPVGDLPAGSSMTARFAVRVDPTFAQQVSEIRNTAFITDDGANGPDTNPDDNQATDTTPLVGVGPDLELTKDDGGAEPRPGDLVVYTLTIRNVGPLDVTGVEVRETVPANSTFEPSESSADFTCASATAGSGCVLPVGDLPAGGSVTALFAVVVDASFSAPVDRIRNTALVVDDGDQGPDLSPDNNEATDTTPLMGLMPDLSLVKDDGGIEVEPGDVITYLLEITNSGSIPATGVRVIETVPANSRYSDGGVTTGWSCPAGAGPGTECSLPFGTILAGETITATFAIEVDDPVADGVMQITNTARVTDDGAGGPDPTPEDNIASDLTPLRNVEPPPQPVELTLWKVDFAEDDLTEDLYANPGEALTYVLTLTNDSETPALDLTVHSLAPQHTRLITGSVDTLEGTVRVGNRAGDTHIEVDVPRLAAGESVIISFRVRLEEEIPEEVEELLCQARVSGSNFDTLPSDDPDTFEPRDPTRTPLRRPGGVGEIVAIPTLSGWGMILFTLLLLAAGAYALRLKKLHPYSNLSL